MDDSEVQEELMGVLRNKCSGMTSTPEPASFHRWHNDPLTRGSYSKWPASFKERHKNIRATVDERDWLAGEDCSQHHFISVFYSR